MKKLLSLLLVISVVLMCFGSISLVAFAEDAVKYNDVTYTVISTSADFTDLINANPGGDFAVVTDNVSVASPVASFSGTLIGLDISSGTPVEAMRTIRVDVSSSSGHLGGLFQAIGSTSSDDPAVIKNITLTGSVSSTSTATVGLGGFAGVVSKGCYVEITDCINSASVSGKKAYIGGFVGNSLLENSTSGTGSITIENCKNSADITQNGAYSGMVAGGIIGRHYSPKNLSVNNCENTGNITANITKGYAGGIFGAAAMVEVSSCKNTGIITGLRAGGIGGNVNQKAGSKISKSFNIGAVNGNDAGGFLGYMEYAITIENSFNKGAVTGSANAGKIAGDTNGKNLTVENCYDASELTCNFYGAGTGTISIRNCYNLSENTGAEVNGITPLSDTDMQDYNKFTGFDFDNTWVMTSENNDNSKYYLYPQIRGNLYYPEASETPDEPDPEPEPEPELGSEKNPYKITTPEEFTSLINANKGEGKYFRLEDNISLGDKELDKSYNPVDFQGVFDGNNKTITLYINNTTLTYAGLFGSVAAGSKIKNLTVGGEINTVLNKSYTGGIAGIIDTTDIDNCTNNADIIATGGTGTTAAGIYANVSAGTCNITNCVNNGRIYGTGNCGGIAGYINAGVSNYKNCVNNGYIGGSFNDVVSNYNGGIVARCNRATIENCTNNGQVTGYSYAGGILGNKTGNRETIVKTCVNNGTVNAMKSFEDGGNIGGIVAQYAENATGSLTITSCNNFGATFNHNDYVVRPVISNPSANVTISECDYLAFDNTYDDGIDNTTLKTKEELSSLDLSKFFIVENNEADNGIYSSENKKYYAYNGSVINCIADGDEDYTIVDATINDVPCVVTDKAFSFTVNGNTVVSVTFTIPEHNVTEPVKFDVDVSLNDSVLTEEAKAEIADATKGAVFFSKFTVRESDLEYGFAFSKDDVVNENDTLKAASNPTAIAVFYGNNDTKNYYMASYIKDKDGNYFFFNVTEFTLDVNFTE